MKPVEQLKLIKDAFAFLGLAKTGYEAWLVIY